MRTEMKRVTALAMACSIGLSACQQTVGHKETGGFLLGAAAGAAAGSQVGSGEGKLVAIVVGALIGALAGGAIGRELDEADRIKAAEAARAAANAESAGRVSWKSEKNETVHGFAEPVSPAVADAGSICKNVKSVYYVDGKEAQETTKFCLRDGRWVEG